MNVEKLLYFGRGSDHSGHTSSIPGGSQLYGRLSSPDGPVRSPLRCGATLVGSTLRYHRGALLHLRSPPSSSNRRGDDADLGVGGVAGGLVPVAATGKTVTGYLRTLDDRVGLVKRFNPLLAAVFPPSYWVLVGLVQWWTGSWSQGQEQLRAGGYSWHCCGMMAGCALVTWGCGWNCC